MTDEELAEALARTYDDAKPMTWADGDDDVNRRHWPRVRERWLTTVKRTRHLIESSQREQTAATLLAAVMAETAFMLPLTVADLDRVQVAVALTDALRAALKEGK